MVPLLFDFSPPCGYVANATQGERSSFCCNGLHPAELTVHSADSEASSSVVASAFHLPRLSVHPYPTNIPLLCPKNIVIVNIIFYFCISVKRFLKIRLYTTLNAFTQRKTRALTILCSCGVLRYARQSDISASSRLSIATSATSAVVLRWR